MLLHILLAGAVKVSFFIAALNGFAFVILAFSFYERDGQFDFAAYKVKFKRHQGVPFFIYLAVQSFDFLLVQKKFACPERLMVAIVGKRAGADV